MGEQRVNQGVNLHGGEGVLGHFEAGTESPRLADLGVDVVMQRVRDAGCEGELIHGLATDLRQLGSKILRPLNAVDLVAGGAAAIVPQSLAMLLLLSVCRPPWRVSQHVRL